MDIRNVFQDFLLIILLLNIHLGLCLQDDDYEDGPSFGRCPWIRNKLKNGRVRYRYKGRIAKFLCDSGYELAGKRSSTCVRGQWSNPLPVCVARGCSRVPSIANGRVTEMYRGALLVYDCNPGYTIAGDSSIHCDGRRWNSSPPVCGISALHPETRCDFENPYLCGWTHDPTHDFDWKRNQFATPSGHVGTGPSYDHTFGENKAGYYLYIEASSPRRINDTARLFSPVYPADESGGCFIFWYHMYGATTGGIRVYLKPESHVFGELSPKWEKFGDQGNQWLRGNLPVPPLNEYFQIVIEGIRGESYVGDSAIDDVQLTKLDCESIENMTDTTTESTVTDSCRGRCRGSDTSLSCGCNENCLAADNCCSDYHTLCTEGNETFVQHTDEPLPGDFYGKTTSPVTVALTSTSQLSSEVLQTSTEVPNSSLQSASTTSAASSVTASLSITTSAVTVNTKTAPPSSSSTSRVVSTTAATAYVSTATTPVTKTSTIHVESPKTALYISTAPTTDTSSPKKNTAVSSTTHKTAVRDTTTVTTTSVKTPSTTTFAVITSTSSTPKQTTSTARSTSTTVKPIAASTTPLISTTPTPTPSSTSTTPSSTSTTVATASTTAATTSTTVSPSSSSPTSITESTTILNTVQIPVTQFESSSSSTTDVSSSPSPRTTLPDTTTTPRYNLRPRKTTAASTSILTYSTPSDNSTTIRTYTLPAATTFTSLRTEILSTSPAVSSTAQPKRWFNFTLASTTTVKSTAKTSTTTSPRTTITITRYTPETSKPTFRIFKPTPVIQPSSTATTSESYNMIASKSESSKSNGNPAVTISIAVIVVICIAAGATYYIRRYRSQRQSKLDDDSEMRFLPDSDYMDYSDASALDKILVQ